MKQDQMKIKANQPVIRFVITPGADISTLEQNGVSRPQEAQNLRGLLASISYSVA